jgi:Electron transfer flavoprotein, alpha subunit
MKTLVVAEHNNSELSAATLSVVEAAKKLGKEIDILVAGNSASAVVGQAQSVEGVTQR